MHREEVNRKTFVLRMMVQMIVLGYMAFQTGSGWPLVGVLSVAVMLIVINLRLIKERDFKRSFSVGILLLEWIAVSALLLAVPYAPYYILFIVMLVTAVTVLNHLRDQVILVILMASTPIVQRVIQGTFDFQLVVSFGLLVVFFVLFGYFYRELEAKQAELEIKNQQLRDYAEKEKRWAIEEEQNRIARDIHDTVAHQSTGLIVQLQKLKHAYSLELHDQVEKSISESETVARNMLNEMRHSVRMISPVEKVSSPFQEMFGDFTQLTGLQIQHAGMPVIYSLPIRDQAQLYGLFQEAMTNAKRHGNASHMNIQVEKVDTAIRILIEDDGSGLPENWTEGFGLGQIRKRVDDVKGRLQIGNAKQGVRLSIDWPVQKEVQHD